MTSVNPENTKSKKKKRKRLHVYPRNLLAISGILQVCLLQIHVEAITRMPNVIIGFYLLAFILTSTLNILNGASFVARPGLPTVVGTIVVTVCQLLFGVLYIESFIRVTAFFTAQFTQPEMILSVAFFTGGMLIALIALFYEVKVYRNADDIYLYMM